MFRIFVVIQTEGKRSKSERKTQGAVEGIGNKGDPPKNSELAQLAEVRTANIQS